MNLIRSLILCVAATAFSAYASGDRIVIQKTDGSNIEYNLDDIQKLDFGPLDAESALLIYNPDGTIMRVPTMNTLFRAIPEEAGKSAGFAFGTFTDPGSVEDLWQGRYAFGLQLSNSVLYSEDVNLVDNPSALLTRYTYSEGELVEASSAVTSGNVTTAVNSKNRVVTINLEATFEDGMKVVANFNRRPTDVESIDMLTPPEVFTNEIVYFNMDGVQSIQANISEVIRSSYRNLVQFTFKTEDDFYQATVQIAESLIGETFSFSEAPENSINFRFENVQVSGPNNEFRNQALEATGLVKNNDNGTWTFEFDITNKYKVDYGWGTPTESGTPERVVVYYSGSVTE